MINYFIKQFTFNFKAECNPAITLSGLWLNILTFIFLCFLKWELLRIKLHNCSSESQTDFCKWNVKEKNQHSPHVFSVRASVIHIVVVRGHPLWALEHSCWVCQELRALTALRPGRHSHLCLQWRALTDEVMSPPDKVQAYCVSRSLPKLPLSPLEHRSLRVQASITNPACHTCGTWGHGNLMPANVELWGTLLPEQWGPVSLTREFHVFCQHPCGNNKQVH